MGCPRTLTAACPSTMTPKLTPALSTSATTVPGGTVSSFACRASLATSLLGSIENKGTPARTSRGVVMARCYARALRPGTAGLRRAAGSADGGAVRGWRGSGVGPGPRGLHELLRPVLGCLSELPDIQS